MRSQNLRREIGSTPPVGSSRNKIDGRWSSAHPSANLCFHPIGKTPVISACLSRRPAISKAHPIRSETDRVGTLYMPAKNLRFSITLRSLYKENFWDI